MLVNRTAWILFALPALVGAAYLVITYGRNRNHLPHAAPSETTECAAFDGKSSSDLLVDVCAKLKYVRTLPSGTETHFECPRDLGQLVGLSSARIRSIWGDPDFEEREKWRDKSSPMRRWAYFIGSPKPSAKGGGFPELSLHFRDSSKVDSATCALAK